MVLLSSKPWLTFTGQNVHPTLGEFTTLGPGGVR
jgi:hypothetical protein